MEKDKVIRHFMGIGYEPILNENTGDVHFYTNNSFEIVITDKSILLPKVHKTVGSWLKDYANFNEVMNWINMYYSQWLKEI